MMLWAVVGLLFCRTAANHALQIQGDWLITNYTMLRGIDVDVNGSIVIGAGGVLEMSDAIVDATVDLLPALAAHPDTEALVPLRRPNHYNGEGYKIIADVLAEEARKHIGH